MRRLGAAWSFALALLVSAPVSAQPATPVEPDPATLAIARGREGVDLYERGQWNEALALFVEADQLFHSPVLVLYAARSQRNLGKLVEARSRYKALARETIAPTAPPSWSKAQTDGAAELSELEKEIPSIIVSVAHATPTTTIRIGDVAIAVDTPVQKDPGEYDVVVTDGEQRLSRTITLVKRGGELRVPFALRAAKAPPITPDAPALTGPDGWRVLGVVLTSVGGLSLIGGGIAGGFALAESSSAKEDLNEHLPTSCSGGQVCHFEEARFEDRFSTAYELASAADGLLIAGGITAAVGIVILLLDPGGRIATPRNPATGIQLEF